MFTFTEIAEATGGRLNGSREGRIGGISSDSRRVAPQELFIPLRGDRFDGHRFIPEVTGKGVRAVVAEETCDPEMLQQMLAAGGTVISVKDTLRALGDLSAAWRRRFSIPVIGITG